MRRYHVHFVVTALILLAVGLTVAVSVQAQHPQGQYQSSPGLFQQIRQGLFGPSQQPSRGYAPRRMSYQRMPLHSQPQRQGAPTVGQFFRDLIGEPLPLPGQAQQPHGNNGSMYSQNGYYGQRQPRPAMQPPRRGTSNFRQYGLNGYSSSHPPRRSESSFDTRSALRNSHGERRGSGEDRTRSAMRFRSTRASSDYMADTDTSSTRRPAASSYRSTAPEPPPTNRSASATSSRRTFSSKEEDLLHPQFGSMIDAGGIDVGGDEVDDNGPSHLDSSGTSRRRTANSSHDTKDRNSTPSVPTPTVSMPPPAPAPTPADTEPSTPAPVPTPVVTPEGAPLATPAPEIEPQPEPEPERSAMGHTHLPTAIDPISPRVAEPKVLPPVTSKPNHQVLSTRQAAALAVETVGPRQIVVGKEATYRIILRNHGGVASGKANVTVQVPAWADIAQLNPTSGNAQRRPEAKSEEGIRWEIQGLQPSGHEELIINLIPRDSRPLDLTVSVYSAPVDAQISVEVREPKLRLSVSGPGEVQYGEKVVYELAFANPGTADAENVMVRLMPIDPGDEADIHRIGTVPAGSKQVVEIELVARQSGTLLIQAEATADSGLRSEARREVVVLRPQIDVVVDGPTFRYARTMATYAVRVTNPGNATARSVQLGAMLPAEARFISCTGGGKVEEGSNKITWAVPDLQPGGEQLFTFKCELEKPGVNRIQVAALAEDDLRDANFIATNVETLADLDLDVIDPKGPIPVGEDVVYEVVISNRGSKTADNVKVFAFFDSGIEPTEVHGHRHQIEPGKVSLAPIPKLAPGEKVNVKIVARAETAGTHVFRAEVICPSLSSKLSEQETTRFYGDDHAAANSASGPTPVGDRSADERILGQEPGRVTPSHAKPFGSTPPADLLPSDTNGRR